MIIPLQITVRGLTQSDALEARIRKQVAKLERVHPRITRCHVTVEESNKHQQQGREFKVRVDVSVPGHEIVADHDHDEDVYVALRDAFDAAKHQLNRLQASERPSREKPAP